MNAKRFIKIVETEEYKTDEIKGFMEYLVNITKTPLNLYLLGDYEKKVCEIMHTFMKNYEHCFLIIDSSNYEDEIMDIIQRDFEIASKVLYNLSEGYISLVNLEDLLIECESVDYGDILSFIMNNCPVDDYFLYEVVEHIKEVELLDIGEYRIHNYLKLN